MGRVYGIKIFLAFGDGSHRKAVGSEPGKGAGDFRALFRGEIQEDFFERVEGHCLNAGTEEETLCRPALNFFAEAGGREIEHGGPRPVSGFFRVAAQGVKFFGEVANVHEFERGVLVHVVMARRSLGGEGEGAFEVCKEGRGGVCPQGFGKRQELFVSVRVRRSQEKGRRGLNREQEGNNG